ncbi:hypothetical protein FQN50_005693 [Emmonsiellopsis sp. PD_5]|nr:hypothetical protein FQN50_005693 [Emmonsiellopsis sp. PD_5]
MEPKPGSTWSPTGQEEEQNTNYDIEAQMAIDTRKIQELYDNGTPFFTREMLLSTRDQMREIRAGKSDVFKSKNFLGGPPVVFQVKKGVVVGTDDTMSLKADTIDLLSTFPRDKG